jgi:hypothetical protein
MTLRSNRWCCAIVRCAAAIALLLAGVAPAAEPDSAQARYEQERARCLSDRAPQDQASCLREAAAARDDQRRGGQEDPGTAASYQRNAMQRCQRLPADDRIACEARMRGEGSTSGSVARGAILRELVTRDGPDDSRTVTTVEVPSPASAAASGPVAPAVVPAPAAPASR